MTLEELTSLLYNFDTVSYAYGSFPDNVKPPYISYRSTEDNPIFADGIKVYSEEQVTLDLITCKRDLCLECKLDKLFGNNNVAIKKSFDFNEEQQIHIVTYEFTAE